MYHECRHIMPTGRRCKSPALGGKFYCFHHFGMTHHAQDGLDPRKEPLILPSLEDTAGIQIAVMQVTNALGSGRLTNKQAGLYLYSLQIASTLAARAERQVPVKDPVRSLTCDDWGNYIAEESTICEPPHDCLTCKNRNRCDKFEDYEEEVEELEQQLAEQEEEGEQEEEEREEKELEDKDDNGEREPEDRGGEAATRSLPENCHPERSGFLQRSEGPAFCPGDEAAICPSKDHQESILGDLQANAIEDSQHPDAVHSMPLHGEAWVPHPNRAFAVRVGNNKPGSPTPDPFHFRVHSSTQSVTANHNSPRRGRSTIAPGETRGSRSTMLPRPGGPPEPNRISRSRANVSPDH